MKIIAMDETHLDALAELEVECFATPWSKASFEEYLNNPNAFFFVAIDEEKVIGYIGSYIVNGEAYITNIAVTKANRGLGIGTSLVFICTENAKDMGAEFITLEVRLSNIGAQNLYKKFDYISEGVRPGFYRDPDEDALIMTRRF
ncbi:MAG: ribosomal protein S18-alanine N-acetyltransferase [Ruminococcaceae bacterium]|nr:ribosomal protein S18-alanine N-acetyltransferase [Oscillospiraceae bacterium]